MGLMRNTDHLPWGAICKLAGWRGRVGGVGPTQAIELYKKEAKITLVLGLEAYF